MSDMRPLAPRWDQMTEAELRSHLTVAQIFASDPLTPPKQETPE